jgi:uncharacterized protein
MNDRRLSPAYDFKRAAVDESGMFEGIASSFHGVDSYGDTCVPGCYTRTLAQHKQANTRPAMLFGHDPAQPIGSWQDMREDAQGLRVKGKLTLGVARAREAYELMRDGALGLSIGYQVDDWAPGAKPGQRILKAVTLYEVSLVAMAADSNARILGVKSFQTIRDFEDAARDVLHLTSRQAKALAAGGYSALMGRDDRSEELAELARDLSARADELKSMLKGSR